MAQKSGVQNVLNECVINVNCQLLKRMGCKQKELYVNSKCIKFAK